MMLSPPFTMNIYVSPFFGFGQRKVANLRFFVMGFRGDWKAFKQVFNMVRYYGTDQVGGFQILV